MEIRKCPECKNGTLQKREEKIDSIAYSQQVLRPFGFNHPFSCNNCSFQSLIDVPKNVCPKCKTGTLQEYLNHYHNRSNAESTVNMIKSKFGARVRSKIWTAQLNEVLCKIIAHNICCVIMETNELGIKTDFCPKSKESAPKV